MSGFKRAPRPASVTLREAGGFFLVETSHTDAGERKYTRQRFEKKAPAKQLEKAIQARLDRGLPPFETADERPAGVTNLDVLMLYEAEHALVDEADGGPPPESRATMIRLREMIERFPLAQLAAETTVTADFDKYAKDRRTLKVYGKDRDEPEPKKISVDTIGKEIKHLRAASKHAKRRDRIARHVFEKMHREDSRRLMPAWKPENTKGRIVSPEDQAEILAELNPMAHRLALFLGATGLRKGEGSALDWTKHYRDLPFPHFAPKSTKKSKDRKIPFEAVEAIVGPRQRRGLVFAELGSTPIEIRKTFSNCWRGAVKRSGVTHTRPHDLRHTFGSAVRRRESLEDTATVMGISPMTARTYADHEKDDLTLRAFGKR